MSAYPPAGRALFLALAALSLVCCGGGDGSLSEDARDVQPDRVDPEALRAAVDDREARRFYQAVGWQAVWTKDRARVLLEATGQAEAHGLSQTDFLDQSLPTEPAEREAALTEAAIAYASALARGQTDPRKLRRIYTVPRPRTDVAAGLAQAISSDQLREWLASLPPQSEEYRALSRAFLHYLRQSQTGAEARIQVGDTISPRDADPRVPRIVEALATNGYLDQRQLRQPNPQVYTPQIAQAVRRMQQDFGIKPDGIVGPDTLNVLNTGAADRARQLAVNLERLRWLERTPPQTRIDVNTAAAFLDYWRDGRHLDHRHVVVGEPGWETPQLGSPIYRLVANPTWTVPKSIEEDELADKGPTYFREQNMVRRDGWIVQLPGPKNALGQVKFDMRNDQSIYLHDTPHKQLFAENERHRSHGCIRVQDALGFAFMLAAADGVLPQFEKALMMGEEEEFISLRRQIPVRLLYHTAFYRDGKVHFRTDVYGWDADVARALGREAGERRTLRPHQRGRDIGP
jgi:murein L,D-transpeptidase YcbB/YkuD